MPRYLVRRNCEFTIEIEAASEEAALDGAYTLPTDEWDGAWSACEIDPDETEED